MSAQPIIVGTDGSPTADVAVDRAGELGLAFGATVHVVHGYSSGTSGAWMAAAGGVAVPELVDDEQVKAHAETIVERACERLTRLGVQTERHVCAGDPASSLVSIARDEGAQMIVVGNRGMTGARRVLGSVPNRVSHHARCGVLIVPTG